MFSSIFILFVTTLPFYAQSTPCANHKFAPILKKPHGYKKCVDLPFFNSSLHYNYNPSMGILEIAYRHPGLGPGSLAKWVAWAINPRGKAMIGAQTLVAYRSGDNGSVLAYTSPITTYKTGLAKGALSFDVTGLKAAVIKDEIFIFATIKVPKNKTVINQLWQEGLINEYGTPLWHNNAYPNLHSMASLNLLSGDIILSEKPTPIRTVSFFFGFYIIGWGILMPFGIMIARHYKEFFPKDDSNWFYLHIGCQIPAYMLGATGWAIGLKLNSVQGLRHFVDHKRIGTALFCMATFQVSALVLRPHKDHKYRSYWSKYHHLVGKATVILGLFNISLGLTILKPDIDARAAFFCVLTPWGVVALVLEIVKKSKKTKVAASQNTSSN
ncbi:cytochrome b561 and DOMON domain-containing protein At5g47530-like [Chenopodium quinoa]|uniref:cytochrome b561 and DOMON domain-containing protein At5g47530-like n=1 Tax=Chenopodium quinoa TaxID=63459 RepID=UPI000B794F4A|nr:cytochrome b561 and DOMON domain-containing protein At5g47530-like [Chenopodium quinoa]